MITTRAYLEALIPVLTNDTKIKIKEGNGWSSDIHKRVLTYNPFDLLRGDINFTKGLLIHETGHLNYTRPVDDVLPIEKKYPRIQDLYNMAEDLRIEKKQIDEFGEFAETPITYLNTCALEQNASFNKKLHKIPKYDQFVHGLQVFLLTHSVTQQINIERFARHHRGIYGLQDELLGSLDPEVKEAIAKMASDIGFGHLAREIEYKKDTEELKKLVRDEILPYCQKFLEEAPNKKSFFPIELLEKLRGRGLQAPTNPDTPLPTDHELEAVLKPYISTLTRKLGDILKEKASVNYYGSHKRGKLLSRNAYKVLTNESRIFSKRNNPDTPHYTITMILDESGSMTSDKRHENTYIGSFLLAKTCQNLGFKLNYIGMDDDPREFETISGYRKIRGGGNDEEKAFEMAKIMIDKTDENIIFMMTDGLACSKPQEIMKELEAKYNAKTFAIGIGMTKDDMRAMREVYKHPIQASNTEELPQILINTMSRIITR